MARFVSRGFGGGGAFLHPVVSPHDGQTMFVSCDMGEAFRSTDGGASWTTIRHTELQAKLFTGIQPTSDPATFYACHLGADPTTELGVQAVRKSTDGGVTWVPVTPVWGAGRPTSVHSDPGALDRFVVFHRNGNTPGFALVSGGTLIASQAFTPTDLLRVAGVFFDGANDVYVATNLGLYRWTGGASFSLVSTTGIAGSLTMTSFAGARAAGTLRFHVVASALAVTTQTVFQDARSFYAAGNRVFRMDFDPATPHVWSDVTGFGSDQPGIVSMPLGDVDTVYVAARGSGPTDTRVYKRSGATWTSALVLPSAGASNLTTGWGGENDVTTVPAGSTDPPSHNESFVNMRVPLGLSVRANDPLHVLVTDTACIHESKDGGVRWRPLYVDSTTTNAPGLIPHGRSYEGVGLESTLCLWLEWEPSGQMRAAFNDVVMARSTDGVAWTLGDEHWNMTTVTRGDVSQVAAVGANLFAIQFKLGRTVPAPYMTVDGSIGAQLDNAANLAGPNDVQGGLYRLDGATSIWKPITTGWGNHLATWLIADGGRLYVSVANSDPAIGGIWYTDTPGAPAPTWKQIPGTHGYPSTIRVLGEGHLLVCYAANVVRTTVMGANNDAFQPTSGVFELRWEMGSWTLTDHTISDMRYWTHDVVVHPRDPGIWYACVGRSQDTGGVARPGGLFRKQPGLGWQRLDAGTPLADKSVVSCAVNPGETRPNDMLVCTRFGGLYASRDIDAVNPTFTAERGYSFRAPLRAFYHPTQPEVWTISNGNGLHRATVTTIRFQQETGSDDPTAPPLQRRVAIPSTTPSLARPFQVRILSEAPFDPSGVVFTVTEALRDGTTSVTTYAWTGSEWGILGGAFHATTTAAGLVGEAYFHGTITLTGAVDVATVRVTFSDADSLTTSAQTRLEVAIPTDLAVVLDYSGSMAKVVSGSATRWSIAQEAVNLLNEVFVVLAPTEAGMGDRIGLVRFGGQIAGGATLDSLAAPVTGALVTMGVPPGASKTPAGEGLLEAHAALAPATASWRNRRMVLLSDGDENLAPYIADIRAAASGSSFIPNRTDSPDGGYVIDTCAIGTGLFEAVLQGLSTGATGAGKSYGGQHFPPISPTSPSAAEELMVNLMDILARALSANVLAGGPGPDVSFVVEEGVSELVFVVTASVSFGVIRPDGTAGPVGTSGTSFSFVRISNPTAGTWRVTGIATARALALVDLRLRATFDAGRVGLGVGRPIPLVATLHDDGVPVSGAKVVAHVRSPAAPAAEQVLAGVKAMALSPEALRVRLYGAQAGDAASARATLLDAAPSAASLVISSTVTLREVAPGRYEGEWPYTQEEGSYELAFEARGRMTSGARFERGGVLARYLLPIPSDEHTEVAWTAVAPPQDGVVDHRVAVTPRTASGRLVGPGLADQLTLRANDTTLALFDQLDGSYSAKLSLREGTPRPRLHLGLLGTEVPLGVGHRRCRRVRVVLDAIRILDDHDGAWTSPGEIVFHAVVMPDGEPSRAVRKRVPRKGVFSLAAGQGGLVGEVLFDGFVEEGSTLDIALGGEEVDDWILFQRKESLARYHRRLSGDLASWAGKYGPGDEARDPETLRDWQVWLGVEVG